VTAAPSFDERLPIYTSNTFDIPGRSSSSTADAKGAALKPPLHIRSWSERYALTAPCDSQNALNAFCVFASQMN
jgi:hypothetical protein